jgi:predicted MFS family arabinose efflux permease
MNAWIFFTGGMGALAATAPVEALLHVTDWRSIFVGLAMATVAASALIYFVAPERKGARDPENTAEQVRGLLSIFADGRFWRLAASTVVFQATHMSVQGLWAGPWLKDVAQLSRPEIAIRLMLLGGSIVAGFLFWGHAAAWLSKRGVTLITVLKAGLSAFLISQIPLALGLTSASWLTWICFGFFGTSGSLAFSAVSQTYPLTMTGRANTALNLLVFSSAFATQWLLGLVINHWPVAEGSYDPAGYRAAFGMLWLVQAASLAWLFLGTRRSASA